MFKCGLLRSNFSFAIVIALRVVRGLAWLRASSDADGGLGSGGGTRTRDPTIMSRVLLPTELLRRGGAGRAGPLLEPPYGLEP